MKISSLKLAGVAIILATLVVACQVAQPPADLTFGVDPDVTPIVAELPGIGDGPPRPVASLVDDEGAQIDFAANELILATDDQAALDAFLARWDGEVLMTVDPAASGIATAALHLVRVRTSGADASQLVDDLRALEPDSEGAFQVSGDEGLALLAAAASEAAHENLSVAVNWILTGNEIVAGSTVEAPTALGSRSSEFTPNAFDWPYMNRGSAQNIGVADAWRALVAAGVLAPDRFGILETPNPITVMVMDGGFQFNTDFPGYNSVVSSTGPNPWDCSGGSACPWHGTEVVLAGMGRPDNEFGAAGPGGPVARVVTVPSPNPAFSSVPDFFAFLVYPIKVVLDVATSRPHIINISAGVPVPFPLNKLVNLVADPFFSSLRAAGMLVFASAGNDGKDVNRTRGRGPFRHQKYTYIPCESASVICVGGLAWDSREKHGSSSFGTRGGVDIFGPFEVWVGPNPDDRVGGGLRNIARIAGGTSFSSPFVAGVAALIWAANPSLNAFQVERILMETAHTNTPDDRVPRWVNAFGAVQAVLGNVPPTVEITAPRGAVVERGLNHTVRFEARTFDFEDGGGCCSVTWSSSQDGTLGTGAGTSNTLEHTFTSEGSRIITATTQNGAGATSSTSFTLHVVNTPPDVTITRPVDGDVSFRGVPVILRATSFDPNEPGTRLSCDRLSWTSSFPSDPFPVTGCEVEVTFTSNGTRTLVLTGRDPQGASGSSSVGVSVVDPPANLPPFVRITAPENDADVGVNETITLAGTATDPEGETNLTYLWTVQVNDGAPVVVGNAPSVQWTPSATIDFSGEGSYVVQIRLSVSDSGNNTGSDFVVVRFHVIN